MRSSLKTYSLSVMAILMCRFSARAEAPAIPASKSGFLSSCQAEKAQFCAENQSDAELLKCLFINQKSLSSVCNEELERIVAAKKAEAENEYGALSAFSGPNLTGPPIPILSLEGHLIPMQNAQNEEGEGRFDLSFPLYQTKSNTVGMSLAGEQIHFAENIVLNSGRQVSSDLTRLEVGAQYTHMDVDHSMWGLKTSIGYAGDTPSEIPRDASYSFTATHGFMGSGTDYWVFFVFMANNSQLANYIPIPGFVYIHKSEHFTGMFGFPILSMQWTPVNPWSFSVSVFGITAQAEAIYGRLGRHQWFIGYGYTLESFIPLERDNDRYRLIVHEQKTGPGLRIPIQKRAQIELQAGWSYDRWLALETGLYKQDGGATGLMPGAFGNLSLKYAF